MKSLKIKLLIIIYAIVIVSNLALTLIGYGTSKKELVSSVNTNLNSVANTVATQVYETNEKEFQLLSALVSLESIRNPDVSLKEKCSILNAIAEQNISTYRNISYCDINGNSYAHTGKLINSLDKDYIKKALSGKRFIQDPFISSIDNSLTMVYAVPVYDFNNNISGALVIILDGNTMCRVVSKLTVGKENHPTIINMKTGLTIGSVNIDDVKNKQTVNQNSGHKGLDEILRKATNGETGSGFFTEANTRTKMIATYKPVGDNCDWTVLCIAPYNDFFGGLYVMLSKMLIIFIVSAIIAFIVSTIIIGSAIKPLKIVNSSIHEIAEGNADLTKRIKVTTKDEVGSVVDGFNKFSEKLQSIVGDIKSSETVLSGAGSKLLNITTGTATAITQMLNNIGNVTEQITNQSSSVEETAGAVNEIASNIASLERMIESQSAGVTQASAAVEEMIGNISAVNQSVEKMASSFTKLLEDSENGMKKQKDVNERIQQIDEQSRMLQNANHAIAEIASETNLLAMNAAIEAAHAGDAGKGFSVVADEIRKLSETSTTQSKTIGDQLKKIKNSIADVVSASSESGEAFNSVSMKISTTDELVKQIEGAMKEQQEGSIQINEALHSMNDSTSEVRTASTEMSAGNKAILDEVQRLQEATVVMKDSIDQMKTSTSKISESGKDLTDISSMMESSIKQIGNQIDKFTV